MNKELIIDIQKGTKEIKDLSYTHEEIRSSGDLFEVLAELQSTDIIILRALEDGIKPPVEWVQYRKDLRLYYKNDGLLKPPRPEQV